MGSPEPMECANAGHMTVLEVGTQDSDLRIVLGSRAHQVIRRLHTGNDFDGFGRFLESPRQKHTCHLGTFGDKHGDRFQRSVLSRRQIYSRRGRLRQLNFSESVAASKAETEAEGQVHTGCNVTLSAGFFTVSYRDTWFGSALIRKCMSSAELRPVSK